MGDMAFEPWLVKLEEQRTRRPVSNKINRVNSAPTFSTGSQNIAPSFFSLIILLPLPLEYYIQNIFLTRVVEQN